MKNIHLIHHNDADGYASAAVVLKYFIFKYEALADYGIMSSAYDYTFDIDLSLVGEEDIVFIMDYSLTREGDFKVLTRLSKEKNIEVIWIDHHVSSKRLIEDNVDLKALSAKGFINTDNQYSGCMLAYVWALFHSVKDGKIDYKNHKHMEGSLDVIASLAPRWIQLVSDYDTFRNEMKDSSDFCLGTLSDGLFDAFLNMEKESFLSYDSNDSSNLNWIIASYIDKGNAIGNYLAIKNEELLERNGIIFNIKLKNDNEEMSFKALVLNTPSGNSNTFGKYFNKFDAVIRFNQTNNLDWYHSIYSREDSKVDCGKFAECMKSIYNISGGGHKHAAGFITTEPIFAGSEFILEEMILEITKEMTLSEYKKDNECDKE